MSAKGLVGWVLKKANFADVHYCIYADILGGSEKFQNYAVVIYGWSFTQDAAISFTKLIVLTNAIFLS
jgi:hypothetical protein